MVSINEMYPSKYLKAADLQGRNIVVTISLVEIEKIGDDNKPVIYFLGKTKGAVLNKTNASNIAILYGDETEDWVGKEIVLFPAMVDFQGRTVEAIRVRGVRAADKSKGGLAPKPAAPLPQQNEPPPVDDMNDSIPF